MKDKKLTTESYKGVRDFYPQDAFVRDYIIETMARVCERFGYEHYDASVLEPSELYLAKASESEEIVRDQTYTFTDRGGREVTLRPEMTPTAARMVAARRRELPLPLRWYSIPNLFRYERAQRGRLREHWQLNADIFGADTIDAEVENIHLAYSILREFGASDADFEVRINDRALLNSIFDELDLSFEERQNTMRIMDKKAKISQKEFESELRKHLADKTELTIEKLENAHTNVKMQEIIGRLADLGVNNTRVDTGTVRGFNYYTGVVFEIFDTNEDNNRSIMGGGRYDNLTQLFGGDAITAVGFGMGDVTVRDFLETHELLPQYVPASEVAVCTLESQYNEQAMQLAAKLREQGLNVTVNFSEKKIGDKIKAADKAQIPFVIAFGQKEAQGNIVTVKHLPTHNEQELAIDKIADFVFETS